MKTQIWCAVATYVLIATVKKELQLKASLYTCLQIFRCLFSRKRRFHAPCSPMLTQPNHLTALSS